MNILRYQFLEETGHWLIARKGGIRNNKSRLHWSLYSSEWDQIETVWLHIRTTSLSNLHLTATRGHQEVQLPGTIKFMPKSNQNTSESLISFARSLMSCDGFMFSGSSSSCSRRAWNNEDQQHCHSSSQHLRWTTDTYVDVSIPVF